MEGDVGGSENGRATKEKRSASSFVPVNDDESKFRVDSSSGWMD